MDTELLMALMFLWCSTTMALVIFLSMWFRNRGESFHPHSIEVDARHSMFLVVDGRTRCKPSFVVKSISAFVAPRGSSSNKYFTSLILIMSVAGMFGTLRWNAIEDASFEETRLAIIGFGALILTAAFETDVSNGRFMEDKLMITTWLINKLHLGPLLPFPLHANSLGFRLFLRQSSLYRFYQEEDIMYVRAGDHTIHNVFPYMPWWSALHTLGAVVYVLAIPTAVIWNEEYPGSHLAGVLTWVAFLVFCLAGYLTGTYLPVLESLQCIVLIWNPFFMSSTFLEELHSEVVKYSIQLQKDSQQTTSGSYNASDDEDSELDFTLELMTKEQMREQCRALGFPISGSKLKLLTRLRNRKTKTSSSCATESDLIFSKEQVAKKISLVLKNNACLRFAKNHPQDYLHLVGHLLVMFEMVAVLLPSIAIGIAWITALCPDNPVNSFLDLIQAVVQCFFTGSGCDFHSHCILMQ